MIVVHGRSICCNVRCIMNKCVELSLCKSEFDLATGVLLLVSDMSIPITSFEKKLDKYWAHFKSKYNFDKCLDHLNQKRNPNYAWNWNKKKR